MSDDSYVYDNKINEIDCIEFGIFGNKEVIANTSLDRKSVGINIADLYEKISGNITTPSKKYVDSIKERERQLG